MRHIPWFVCGLFVIGGCQLHAPLEGLDQVSPDGTELIGSTCTVNADCSAPLSCVDRSTDAAAECHHGDCWIYGAWNLSQIIRGCPGYTPTPPATNRDAGAYSFPDAYSAPPTSASRCSVGLHTPVSTFNQGAGLRSCIREHGLDGRTYFTSWANVICDTGPCTVEVVSLASYVVTSDGHIIPVASGIGWAAVYRNFFSADDWHMEVSPMSGSTYTVPRLADDRILHLGVSTVSIGGYTDAFTVMEFRTTGDAQVQVGGDARYSPGDTSPHEMGASDWAACNTGGTIRLASPRSDMDCAATLGSISGGTPPPPTSTGHAISITLPSSGTDGCGGAFSATAWGADAAAHYSSGNTLTYTETGSGFLWWNLYCNGTPWGSNWGGVGARASGLSGLTILVDGANRTADTTICSHGGGLMPVTWLDSGHSGCP